MDAQVSEIASMYPNVWRRGLVALCVAQGIKKSSAQSACWKLNLGRIDKFDGSLAVLIAFVSTHGRLPFAKESFHGLKIGTWCQTQRQAYKKGKLPDARINLLRRSRGGGG